MASAIACKTNVSSIAASNLGVKRMTLMLELN